MTRRTPGYDPHRSTSHALTQVRTVLQRARTAQQLLGEPGMPRDGRSRPPAYNGYLEHEGPDLERMREALQRAIQLLEPWERAR